MSHSPSPNPSTLDFFEVLRRNVASFPERVAFQILAEESRETFTYARVAEDIRKISLLLARAGVGSGDTAGILMENHPRWGIAFLAAQSAGAIVVPLDILHDHATLAKLIQHAECRFMIVSERLAPVWKQVQALLGAPLPFLVAGEKCEAAGWETAPLPLVERGLDDGLMILYTSGTTGNPKGVALTRRNVYRNVVEAVNVVGPTAEDHFLSVLPLYHILSLVINFMIPVYLGARVTFLQSLEAQKVLKAFREEGVTIFICVPQFFYLAHRRIMQEVARQSFLKRFLFRRLLAVSRFCNLSLGVNPGRFFFKAIHEPFGPTLRLLGVGGARFDPQVAGSFRDLGFNLAQAFGMTETAALITIALPKGRQVGTAGAAMSHDEVRIKEPGENGVGEVLVRGENVMPGYYKNPEATAEALKDGWLHTGDLGFIDSGGFLHVTGRMKDVIVLSSGKNIYPEEIEKHYQSEMPYIKEICVIGVPDTTSGEGGEKLHAVIVPDFDYLKNEQILSAYETIRWRMETVSQSLPAYKRVMSLEIRTEPLPLTTTRKIKRFEVQREVLDRGSKPPAAVVDAAPETPVETRLFALLRSVKDAPAINPAMNLELDLGFTSLERVEMLSSIQEAFGARIPEVEAARIHTVAELILAVQRLQTGGAVVSEDEAQFSWDAILAAPLEPEDARTLDEALRPRPVVELIYFLLSRVLAFACRLLLRFRVEGRENLVPSPGLLCPNHASFLDGFLLVSAVPYSVLRRMFILADIEYFKGPLLSRAAGWIKVITVTPDRGVRTSLRLAAEGLRRGMTMCVFPEGERSIDGTVKVFRKGSAILATELGLKVAPVGIRGAWDVWRRGSNRIRLRPVTLVFGKPLEAAGKTTDAFNDELREAVIKLL
jgi:long-chain acyl-CoA synthetase